jgi:hypothetical protein
VIFLCAIDVRFFAFKENCTIIIVFDEAINAMYFAIPDGIILGHFDEADHALLDAIWTVRLLDFE